MSDAPLPPGLRPGGAADVKSGLESRLFGISADQSQDPLDLSELRFRRSTERLHRLGPRPLAEMLAELGARHLLRTEIEAAIDSFAGRLNPVMVDAAGGRDFAPVPLHSVRP